ncbi:MAG: gliding motility-associated ABC transporter permease subunit GldF [Saprospiraceae bacterium]|nr:gliding motility-associated ABC transporter permease subunit GldF [Saprospiraceae bacterium]
MWSIFTKEIQTFFSGLTGYIVLVVFLVMTGLFMWVISDTSVLNYNYASLGQLFSIAPLVFIFLIPAITMQSFAEEKQQRTIEFLTTKPLTDIEIILGKFGACLTLVIVAIIPTLIYYYSIVQLGSPIGNIDTGAVIGSYIGLIFLAGGFTAIGLFMSSLTANQIIAFILAAFACFSIYWVFEFLSNQPLFYGKSDDLVKYFGMEYHYDNISKGRIDSKDLVYFLSVIVLFIWLTKISLDKRKW